MTKTELGFSSLQIHYICPFSSLPPRTFGLPTTSFSTSIPSPSPNPAPYIHVVSIRYFPQVDGYFAKCGFYTFYSSALVDNDRFVKTCQTAPISTIVTFEFCLFSERYGCNLQHILEHIVLVSTRQIMERFRERAWQ